MSSTIEIPDLIRRIDDLAAVLEEETALLDALDLAGAAKLLPHKEEAVAALQDAASRIGGGSEEVTSGENEALLGRCKAALQEQAEANQAALVRSLELQGRLMQTIAKAVPAGRAEEAPSYLPDGRKVATRPLGAYAFQQRM